MNKKQKIWNVTSNIFKLEMTKGHLRWKVSDLARLSGVSRPLIYHYFGKTKKEIFKMAFDLSTDEIYCFSPEKQKQIRDGDVVKAILNSRKTINTHYYFQVFTHRWRHSGTDIEDMLVAKEKQLERQLSKQFPKASKKEILSLHVSLHGLLTAPFVSDKEVEVIVADLFSGSKYLR